MSVSSNVAVTSFDICRAVEEDDDDDDDDGVRILSENDLVLLASFGWLSDIVCIEARNEADADDNIVWLVDGSGNDEESSDVPCDNDDDAGSLAVTVYMDVKEVNK